MDENTHNPTIVRPNIIYSKNYFLIKYKSEVQRKKYSDLVLKLVRKFEIKDYHIGEEEAFQEPRVLYNCKTVLKDDQFDFSILQKEFLRYYEY